MGTTYNATSAASLIKQLYPQRRIDANWMLNYPFMAMVKKSDRFEGSQVNIPVEHDGPARSRVFSNMIASGGGSAWQYPTSNISFALTRVRDYSVARLDAETMRSMRSDKGGFVRLLDRSIQNALNSLKQNTAVSLYRNHGGALGQFSSDSSDVWTLVQAADAANFHVGQEIAVSSADGTSGSLRTGTTTVTSVNFDAGTITVESDDITGETANDYIFAVGDFGVSMRGLASWLPLTAPSAAESFLGVDRSVNVTQLAGHRLNDTSLSIEECLQTLASRISYSGGNPDKCFMSPLKLKDLCLEIGSKVVRDPGGKGVVGFSGVLIQTPAGPVEVYGDPACPNNRAYLLDMSSCEFIHLDGFPHIVEDDGLKSRAVFDQDQLEVRCRLWGNLAFSAPGKNGVCAL